MTRSACILLAVLAVLLCVPSASGEESDRQFVCDPHGYFWVPDHTPTIRGVIFLNGYGIDARWQEAAILWDFAIIRMATHRYGEGLDRPRNRQATGVAIEYMLQEIAERTGHDEVLHAPFLACGFSRHSGAGHFVASRWNGRLIAMANGFNYSFGRNSPDSANYGDAYTSALSMAMATEYEQIWTGDGIGPEEPHNEWNRPEHVRRMYGMTWGTRHNPYNYSDLAIPFFHQAIALRVPEDWDPHAGPPALREVPIDQGWLGSHEHFDTPEQDLDGFEHPRAIMPADEFTGNVSAMSWIPNRPTAFVWRGYHNPRPRVQIIAPTVCAQKHLPGNAILHVERDLRAGEPFTMQARCLSDDVLAITFFANDVELATVTRDAFTSGELALGSSRDAVATAEATLPEGAYGLMARYTRRAPDDSETTGWSQPAVLLIHSPEQ